MKQITAFKLEQLRQNLKDLENEKPRNLTPFFDLKMFELNLPIEPSAIVCHAFPKANIGKAQIFERLQNDFTEGITDFFTHLEDTDRERQLEIAFEFCEAVNYIINLSQSDIWEYVPDEIGFDELYDYIGWGFTYITINPNNHQCLIIHGGYCD